MSATEIDTLSLHDALPILPRPSSPLDDLTDAELLVYEALPARAARTVDQIAVACGMPPQEVLAPLSMLELAGLVVRRDGRWQLARRWRRWRRWRPAGMMPLV